MKKSYHFFLCIKKQQIEYVYNKETYYKHASVLLCRCTKSYKNGKAEQIEYFSFA